MNALTRHYKKEIDYIEKKCIENLKSDKWRLGYHLMPPIGWLNDPNGLCYYKGEYHMFFQYSPFEAEGGLKFWGHYKSKDLINWKYLGVPLMPDQPYDCHGAYSGSALVEDDKMYLYYTGNVKNFGENYDYINTGREGNTVLAIIEDGINVASKKCLLKNEDYPNNLTCHVRDPKVWKENDKYYMVLGARTKEDKGIILLYKSLDKVNWTFENTIESKEKFGYMWECPDLFMLDNETILMFSPQGIEAEGYKYQNIYQSGYYLVEGDYKTSDYNLVNFTELDRGFDFYAPQTFLDDKGRRILVGWLGLPDIEEFYSNKTVKYGWQHALTIPRVLSVVNKKLYQKPIDEIKQLRKDQQTLNSNRDYQVEPSFELIVENTNKDIDIVIENEINICYKDNLFTLKFNSDIGAGRTSRSVELKECNKINIFVDKSTIEIFINDGEEVLTTRFYPTNDKINLNIVSDNTKNTLYMLNSFLVDYNL